MQVAAGSVERQPAAEVDRDAVPRALGADRLDVRGPSSRCAAKPMRARPRRRALVAPRCQIAGGRGEAQQRPGGAAADDPVDAGGVKARGERDQGRVRAGGGSENGTCRLYGLGRSLLHHNADLLRQRGAARRPRVHDDHERHPGPAPPPAWRRRVLPDRHRRARRQDRARRRGARAHAQGTHRRHLRSVPRVVGHVRAVQRLLHPHDRRGAQGRGAAGAGAHPRRPATSTRARTAAGTARRARPSTARTTCSRASSARSTAGRSSGSRRRTGSSGCRPTATGCSRCTTQNPPFVRPAAPPQRGAQASPRPVEDISISRANVTWGVPVPWDPDHVVYVWVDALLNYYTALSYARPGEDMTERLWPADLQVLGKDILKFHAVIWPALLMAAGLEPPRGLFIHGFVLKGGERLSQDDRQPDRPAAVRRAVRHRRAALVPGPRDPLRRGRARSATRASTAATTASWPTSSATCSTARSA